MADVIPFEFPDDGWHNLNLVEGAVTIRNRSGMPVSIYRTEVDTVPTDESLAALGINPLEIGGSINEISTEEGEFVYGKAVSGQGAVTVRHRGTIDPSEDITYLAAALDSLTATYLAHSNNKENPHDVTKEQVGLGAIPNAISDDIEHSDSDTLATTKLTSRILDIVETHLTDTENPHDVTKEQVGLGSVPNYPAADENTGKDSTRADLLMTPIATYNAVKAWIQIAMSMKPQTVTRGQVTDRLQGWSSADCSAPTNLITKISDTTVRVLTGLRVAFAEDGKTRESFDLAESVDVTIATPQDGVYYLFANIDALASFESFGVTKTPYKEGSQRDGHVGDFFSVARNVMYDENDNPIRRVYIGKIYVIGGVISSILSAPIGEEVILPVTQEIVLGGRDLYSNPFLGPSDVKAEVEYNFEWGESGWNDQIGVIAKPHPTGPIDRIILQCGMMGFLASGKEAGSPFAANFTTVTTPIRARIVVRKKF